MNALATNQQVIAWTIRIVSLYFIIDAAEKLTDFKNYKKEGFFGQDILQRSGFYKLAGNFTRCVLYALYSFKGWLLIILVRLGCGIWVLIWPQQGLELMLCLLALFIAASLLNMRQRPFTAETPNRLALFIIGMLFLQSLHPTPAVTGVCIWVIALQACVTYATAGFAKLRAKEWRNGNGLLMAINSREMPFSNRRIIFFNGQKALLKLVTWAVILMDCIFPLVLIVGHPYFLFFVIWGITFHFVIAVFLRLGKYLIVWMATYPAIIFVAAKCAGYTIYF